MLDDLVRIGRDKYRKAVDMEYKTKNGKTEGSKTSQDVEDAVLHRRQSDFQLETDRSRKQRAFEDLLHYLHRNELPDLDE
jgi:hypothetical protein